MQYKIIEILKKLTYLVLLSSILMACSRSDNTQHNAISHKTNTKATIDKNNDVIYANLNEQKTDEFRLSLHTVDQSINLTQKQEDRQKITFGSLPKGSPFSIQKENCTTLSVNSYCNFVIYYRPSKNTDFFNYQSIPIHIGMHLITLNIMGVPKSITPDSHSTFSFSPTASTLWNKQLSDSKKSIPYESYAFHNSTGHTLNLSIKNAPAYLSSAENIQCLSSSALCQYLLTYSPNILRPSIYQFISSINKDMKLQVSYKNISAIYSLGSNEAVSYGQQYFVNPETDIGNAKALYASSVTKIIHHNNITFIIAPAAVEFSSDNGQSWQSENALTNLSVKDLAFDSAGHVIIASTSGLYEASYDTQSGIIDTPNEISNIPDKLSNPNTIKLDQNNQFLYVGSRKGLVIFNYNSSTATVSNSKTYLTNKNISLLSIDYIHHNLIGVYNSHCLFQLDLSSSSLTNVDVSTPINTLLLDPSNTHLLLGTNNGIKIYRYDANQQKFDPNATPVLTNIHIEGLLLGSQGSNLLIVGQNNNEGYLATATYKNGNIQTLSPSILPSNINLNSISLSKGDIYMAWDSSWSI